MWRLINYRLKDYGHLKGSCWELFYRWLNVAEAAVWLAIAIYVFSRYSRNKKTPYEVVNFSQNLEM
jgi:NADH:ubiquinone oxidoreductase subunit K